MVEFRGITKRFGGVHALQDVSFTVQRGSIHAIVGENGAGKSTLMNILAGIHRPDHGEVLLNGSAQEIASPRHARARQIALVPQEPALCPNLSVGQNLFLGQEPACWGFISRTGTRRNAQAILDRAQLALDPETPVSALSSAQRHLLYLARALAADARILILDEPTAALSAGETTTLFTRLLQLKQAGVTILYVSHRLPEVFSLCDQVTTLRDGRHVATQAISIVTPSQIVLQMVGREVQEEEVVVAGSRSLAAEQSSQGEVLLEVTDLSRRGAFYDVSFCLRRGEIVALAGLVGSGRTEVARCLFGLDHPTAGSMLLNGQAYQPASPSEAIGQGIALVPEDRPGQGLIMQLAVLTNLTLPALAAHRTGLVWGPWVKRQQEQRLGREISNQLSIKAAGLEAKVDSLSGGNQQKVVLGKWLALQPKILIVDEPTQGVDVGAKAQVHRLLQELAAQGVGILMISSDLPEVLHLAHRILVMRQGRLAGELPGTTATAAEVMHLAALGQGA